MHVISLFKATNIFYFTKMTNIPFVDWMSLTPFLITHFVLLNLLKHI